MNYIKNKIQVVKAVSMVTYKEWSAYRTHSMVSIFVGPVYFIVQYFIWKAVYSGNPVLNGMELSQILTYFGVTALIGYLTMDFADWNLQMLARTGKFLTFALRPVHHRFFALSQKIGHRILGFLFEFLPCLFIFVFIFKVNMIPESLGWTVLSIHDLEDVEQLARKVVIINHGQKVFDDKLQNLQLALGSKKIIHLMLTNPRTDIKIEGTEVVEKKSDYEYILEVNLDNSSINTFIRNLTHMCEFSDISIKELPMEKIITRIYEGHGVSAV